MQVFGEFPSPVLMKPLILVGVSLLLAASSAYAVDVYDGIRAPRGLYFLSYSTYYCADVFTGPSGRSDISDFGYQNASQILRLCWYSPDYVLTALVPISQVSSDYLDSSDAGSGDILVAAGKFLPVRNVDLLAFLTAKIPTGSFDESEPINVGSGQWDFRPSLFVHKEVEPYTFDGVVKYTFRRENPDTNVKPGDEFRVELLTIRQLGPVKIGPSASWLIGRDNEQDGKCVEDSAKQMVSLGVEAYFRVCGWSVTLNYMSDVYSENATLGHFFKVKLCRKL
jgi:hypothetical protein